MHNPALRLPCFSKKFTKSSEDILFRSTTETQLGNDRQWAMLKQGQLNVKARFGDFGSTRPLKRFAARGLSSLDWNEI